MTEFNRPVERSEEIKGNPDPIHSFMMHHDDVLVYDLPISHHRRVKELRAGAVSV